MQSLSDPAPRRVHPTRQHGAYALVFDSHGRVLVVRTGNGRHYFPGGRMEPGESPAETLSREMAEECGWSVEVGAGICEHVQPIFGGRVSLQASYWRVRLTAPLAGRPEHDMLWLSPPDAAAHLHRASDRAALDAAGAAMRELRCPGANRERPSKALWADPDQAQQLLPVSCTGGQATSP